MSNALRIDAPAGLPVVDMTREFDAPPSAVYRAHRDPELVTRWLGPDGYEMTVEVYDVRTGGRYRYSHHDPEGNVYRFNGVFHTAREGELIIQTFEYEAVPDVVAVETLRFEALEGGRTRLHTHSVHADVATRDAMISSGMERGVREGYARLDRVLAG
ncbi:SRPBCC family protein [Streptomyces lonarensis]|uniref:SRPBCC family protein n=1 Tax=Streptomyces lonarensis TaxID=700599 RepID=A0A7X6D4R1_9ACTN|nr:SRPBCC family protein [Streptomyces lonarensis]NJQ08150.1 SRPBCC family protein [Streptomyces lonarensis]